jgi:hypothetical protein
MLAAWVDGGLSQPDRALAEVHLSDCSRCRAIVAALAPRLHTAPTTPTAWWRRSGNLRWLVPLTAAAAATVIWVAVPNDNARRPPDTPPGRTEPATAQDKLKARAQDERTAAPASTVAPGEARAESKAASEALAKAAEPDNLNAVTALPAPPLAREMLDASALTARADAAAAPPATAPSVPSPERRAESTGALSETVATSRQAFADGRAIGAADPSVRWRLGAAGVIQRSTDGGANWEMLPTGVATELTAGAAPSTTVCWVVGRAGTVLLTTDGQRWQRVAFPEAVDLTAVQANDARTVIVTTADGRRFRSIDGGGTWQATPLQEF